MSDDKKKKKKAHLHDDLEGFSVSVNPFGQIESTFDIDRINKFLNEKVDDKKLREGKDSDEEE